MDIEVSFLNLCGICCRLSGQISQKNSHLAR
jgi:hypothetical protein